eukprot:7728024-Pyramimonas_sp.AAC.1
MRVGHKQYLRVLPWGVQAFQSFVDGHRIEIRPLERLWPIPNLRTGPIRVYGHCYSLRTAAPNVPTAGIIAHRKRREI